MYGRIDEVRISSAVRYTANFVPQVTFAPDAATIALYHFDENTGTTAADSSGNGHDGTLKGATWSTDHP